MRTATTNWSSVANTWGGSLYEGPGYHTLANGRLPSSNADSTKNFQNITTMTQSRAALDELTLDACTNAKAKGIVIYTIGFSISTDPIDSQGQTLLPILRPTPSMPLSPTMRIR